MVWQPEVIQEDPLACKAVEMVLANKIYLKSQLTRDYGILCHLQQYIMFSSLWSILVQLDFDTSNGFELVCDVCHLDA